MQSSNQYMFDIRKLHGGGILFVRQKNKRFRFFSGTGEFSARTGMLEKQDLHDKHMERHQEIILFILLI